MSCSKWLFQYPNEIMVETGSGGGGGIDSALKYGFKKIYSIEINKESYHYCVERFKKQSYVNLYLGDTINVLPNILLDIKEKVTFLLDAHVMKPQDVHGETICPILKELDMIVNHSKRLGIKHSILIDDTKYFNGKTETFGNIKSEDIKQTILDIDASYSISINRRMIVAI